MVICDNENKDYIVCPSAMPSETTYRTYTHRWYVLIVTCLLALSNAAIWISFSSIGSNVNMFYCDKSYFPNGTDGRSTDKNPALDECNVSFWANQIFQIVGCIGGIFGIFVTDKYGILVSTYCAAGFNFVGILLRTISSIPSMGDDARIWLLYTGQVLAASAQPFFLVLSPKVAEYWFADHQRAFANSLSFAANPMGVVLGTVAPELIIHLSTGRNTTDLLWLNALLLTLATIVMLMTFGIRSKKPPTPPSASSATDHSPPLLQGFWKLFTIPVFYILMVSSGMCFALQWSLITSIEDMMHALGYKFIGFASALSAIAGFGSSILAGYFVDKTKCFSETIKGCTIGIAIVACLMNVFVRHHSNGTFDSILLACLLMMLGFFSIPAFPISLELGLETTFPIAEASSSGVLIIVAQLLLFLMSAILNATPRLDWFYTSKKSKGHELDTNAFDANYQLTIDVWTFTAVVACIFTCSSLWPRYKRLEYEQSTLAQARETEHNGTSKGTVTEPSKEPSQS